MPHHLQDLWLAHARNRFSGAYLKRGRGGRKQSASDARAIEDAALGRARE